MSARSCAARCGTSHERGDRAAFAGRRGRVLARGRAEEVVREGCGFRRRDPPALPCAARGGRRRQTHRLGSERRGRAGAAHSARSVPAQHVPWIRRAPSPAIRWRAPSPAAPSSTASTARYPDMRGFFYLPFEHSEDIADQERGLTLYKAAGDDDGLKWAGIARRHHPPLRPLPASQRRARPRQHAGGTEVSR